VGFRGRTAPAEGTRQKSPETLSLLRQSAEPTLETHRFFSFPGILKLFSARGFFRKH
jgi:hypothetical protein